MELVSLMSGTNYTRHLTSVEICSILDRLVVFKSAKLKFRGLELEVSNVEATPVVTESSVGVVGAPENNSPVNKQEEREIDDASLIALSPEDFEEREIAGEFNEEPNYSESE